MLVYLWLCVCSVSGLVCSCYLLWCQYVPVWFVYIFCVCSYSSFGVDDGGSLLAALFCTYVLLLWFVSVIVVPDVLAFYKYVTCFILSGFLSFYVMYCMLMFLCSTVVQSAFYVSRIICLNVCLQVDVCAFTQCVLLSIVYLYFTECPSVYVFQPTFCLLDGAWILLSKSFAFLWTFMFYAVWLLF